MCKVEVGKKFVTKYNETIEVIEKLPNKRCMIKFLCNERVITSYNVSVRDNCCLKHEYTKSYMGIGMLGYINEKEFKHTQKEKRLWNNIMRKYSKQGIECEEYCVFKDFCLKLRELDDYDKLMNDNIPTRLIVDKDGSMEIQDVEFLKPVKRVHVKTGKIIYYNTLNECANAIGLSSRTVKDYIRNKNVYRGYKIEFIES